MKIRLTLFINIFICSLFFCALEPQIVNAQQAFRFENAPLRSALDSLMQWYPDNIVYLDHDIENITVWATCSQCTIRDALNALLGETQLQWMRLGNQIIIKKREQETIKQFINVSGVVRDSVTGECIAGATIMLQEISDQPIQTIKYWCSTNAFGFYALPKVQSNNYTLIARAVGYETFTHNLDLTNVESQILNIFLQQKEIVMSGVTVEGRRSVLSSAETFARGIYFRSVPSDQNQYLLDGGRIYNPSRFGGVLTTFNTAMLSDVQVALSGPPPFYGGRMGGIVDLALRGGMRHSFSASTSVGSFGSSLTLEGPIDNSSTFLISGRKGYPDATIQFFNSSVTPSDANSFEFTGKINHRISNNSQISLNGYISNDSYANDVSGVGEQLSNNFSWKNSMLNLRWSGIASSSLFLYSSLVYSRYNLELNHKFDFTQIPLANERLSSNYSIEDISLRAHAESYYDNEHTIHAGVEIVSRSVSGYVSEFSIQSAPFSLSELYLWELSVYLQDQWKILSNVLAEIGGRATNFTSKQGSFSAIDPRFSVITLLNEQTRAYASVSAVNQFIHTFRNSGVCLLYPTIFYYPSTEKLPPSTSLQAIIGIQRETSENAYRASTEIYYRITNNLHEFKTDTLLSTTNDISDLLLLGASRSYGAIFKIEKRLGDLTGSVTYNLSWNLQSFAEINNGVEFAPPFDRRHEIQFTSRYTLSEKWGLSLLCVYAPGQSYVVTPKATSTNPVNINVREKSEINALSYNDFLDVNGSRLPGFQRLEINASRRFDFGRLSGHFSIRFVNSYGLTDPFRWELDNSQPLRYKWKAIFRDTGIFPLYPSLEMTIKL